MCVCVCVCVCVCGGGGVGGEKKSEDSRQAPTRKTKAAVDRRQNNKCLLRQCPPGIAQRPQHHAIAVPTAAEQSQRQCA